MIGARIRLHLVGAGTKAAQASLADASGVASALALEAQLEIQCAMAFGSPQALAGVFELPARDFREVCGIAIDLEDWIGALARHDAGVADFAIAMSDIAARISELSCTKPRVGIEHSAHAAPQGTA